MEKLEIRNIIKDINGNEARIYHIENGNIYTVLLNETKIMQNIYSIKEIQMGILDGKLELIKEDSEDIFDINQLTEKDREKYITRKNMLTEIENKFGPGLIGICSKKKETTTLLNEIKNKYNFKTTNFWDVISKYIKSGCADIGLIDQRYKNGSKTGNPTKRRKARNDGGKTMTPEDINHCIDAYTKFFKPHKKGNWQDCYDRMQVEFYLDVNGNLLPLSQIPTMRQFRYAIKDLTTRKNVLIAKTDIRNYQNNERITLGSSTTEALMIPGHIYEVDEQEMDISLIKSEDDKSVISRPICHLMIDVATRLIVAFSVSLDNNSIKGIQGCLANLAEDKVEYCKKLGIILEKPEIWPSAMPNTIRADNGSEYISDDFKRICNENGINLHLMPPGMGSFKGIVEGEFARLGLDRNPVLEGKGYISFNDKHDYHKEAGLTLKMIEKLVCIQVLYHNITLIKYPEMTKEMIEDGLHTTPYEIWNYLAPTTSPRPIRNKEQFFFSILRQCKGATLSKNGIHYKGLYYNNLNDLELQQDIENSKKSVRFTCRIDERDCGHLYYIRNNKIYVASLTTKYNSSQYIDTTWSEYFELQKRRKQIEKENEYNDRTVRLSKKQAITNHIESNYVPGIADKNDVRSNRAEVKIENHKKNLLAKRIIDNPNNLIGDINDVKIIEQENLEQHLKSKEHQTLEILEENADGIQENINDEEPLAGTEWTEDDILEMF